MIPAFLGSLSHSACGDLSDAWPLIQNPACFDSISFCESYLGLTGEDENSFSLETEKTANMDSDNEQDQKVFTPTMSHFGNLTESSELPPKTCTTASLNQFVADESLPPTQYDRTVNDSTN